VAVLALTEEGHAGAKYVLTGPQTLTQFEQVRIIGEERGIPVRYEELSPDVARQLLVKEWGNPAFVDAAINGWALMVTQPEQVTHTVEELTQVPARTFREWAREHAQDFR
jgi:uncharacterized protein YbjT (DUF2867 family)